MSYNYFSGMKHGDAVAEAVVAPLLRQSAPTAGQVQLLVHALRGSFPLDSLPCLLTAAAQVTCWEEGHVAVLQAVLGRQPVLCEVGRGMTAAGVLRCTASTDRDDGAGLSSCLLQSNQEHLQSARCPLCSLAAGAPHQRRDQGHWSSSRGWPPEIKQADAAAECAGGSVWPAS